MYRPAPQVWHADDEYAPAETVYEPRAQSIQAPLLCAPEVVEYVLGGQLLHAFDPDREYEPVTHVRHAADNGAAMAIEKVPAMQLRQAALLDARDAVEYVPAPQLEHCNPIDEEKVPAVHARHAADEEAPAVVA